MLLILKSLCCLLLYLQVLCADIPYIYLQVLCADVPYICRFFVLTYPMKYRLLMSNSRVKLLIMLSWLPNISLLLVKVMYITLHAVQLYITRAQCTLHAVQLYITHAQCTLHAVQLYITRYSCTLHAVQLYIVSCHNVQLKRAKNT